MAEKWRSVLKGWSPYMDDEGLRELMTDAEIYDCCDGFPGYKVLPHHSELLHRIQREFVRLYEQVYAGGAA